MKATLEFSLPEEAMEWRMASRAEEAYLKVEAVRDLCTHLLERDNLHRDVVHALNLVLDTVAEPQ